MNHLHRIAIFWALRARLKRRGRPYVSIYMRVSGPDHVIWEFCL